MSIRSRRQRFLNHNTCLQNLDGDHLGPDTIRLENGIEIRLALRTDGRTELVTRVNLPQHPDLDAVRAIVRLALARNTRVTHRANIEIVPGVLQVRWVQRRPPQQDEILSMARWVADAAQETETAFGSSSISVRRDVIRGLISPDPEIRLPAALAAGSLGYTVLDQLIKDPRVDIDVQLKAAKAITQQLPPEDATSILSQALDSGPEELVRYAIEVLAELEGGSHALAAALRRRRLKPELAVFTVERLTSVVGGEALLLHALPHACTPAQRAMLEHLAETGGRTTHAHLYRLAGKGGLGVALDGALRRAVRATGERQAALQGAVSEIEAPQKVPVGALSEPSTTSG